MWERSHTILLYTTDAPKGIKDSLAILKHCFPIGMPRIVMHQRQPRMQYPIAISRPKKMIQIRLTRKEKPPPPYTTSFPNGKKARLANLKHCRPTGMPMMVMHQRQPASTQASPPINPPNRNQRIFPIVDIVVHLNFSLFRIRCKLSLDPCHQQPHDAFLLILRQLTPYRDMIPLV